MSVKGEVSIYCNAGQEGSKKFMVLKECQFFELWLSSHVRKLLKAIEAKFSLCRKDFDANRAKQAEEVENYEDSSSPKENYPKGSFIAFTLKSLSAGGSAEQKDGPHAILEPSAKEMSRPFASSNSELYGTDLLEYQDTGKYSPPPHCVEFIDFKIGADSGYIQFEEPEAAQKARAAAALPDEYGLVVKIFIATLDPVTGRQQLQHSVTPSDI
ncbi:hypothetical protein RHGRI_006289 [Rhododendron griersonianum]|uniref:Uncharacterized protein n=1 Tax=Rhododendron griersonianum TaxID=479676 RepID=A0AAV6KTK1_9ERIC|nr:hypothetical protein RHGRI_006289 [Rhododendron griersonianum]